MSPSQLCEVVPDGITSYFGVRYDGPRFDDDGINQVTLVPGERGIVLFEMNVYDWDGYVVQFEKAGTLWVEWYKVEPPA